MSSLIGNRNARWPLPRAIDALSESARQAARPGFVWIVGLIYPTMLVWLDVALGLVRTIGEPRDVTLFSGADRMRMWDASLIGQQVMLLTIIPCFGFVLLPLVRLVAGLARLSPPLKWSEACGEHRTPGIGALWEAGRGMTLSTYGLLLYVGLMIVVVLGTLLTPIAYLLATTNERTAWPNVSLFTWSAVTSPLIVLAIAFALVFSAMQQLALHSLALNRRGVASALQHAWRIVRHDPWSTGRAVLVDLFLSVWVLVIWKMLSAVLLELPFGEWIAYPLGFALVGLCGVARAGYWARAYRALGGLSPDDGVPGLSS